MRSHYSKDGYVLTFLAPRQCNPSASCLWIQILLSLTTYLAHLFCRYVAMAVYNTPKGTMRAYFLACVICIAVFMQGYDAGVAGGVLLMKPFQRDYRYSNAQKTTVNALSVGVQSAGAFVGSFAMFPFTKAHGRKRGVMVSAAVFCVGAAIETANAHSLAAWYVGRVLAGLGQGGCSMIVPIYSAEMAPKAIRSKLGSMYQFFFTIGICISYWIDYATVHNIPPSKSSQWQVPIGMQLLSSGLLFFGILTLKESCRWLANQGHFDDAWNSLLWIRGEDSQQPSELVRQEFEDIKAAIIEENRAREGLRLWEVVLEPSNRHRVLLSASIFMFQQATGATALAVFAPQFFQLVVGQGERAILISGLFGAVKVVACGLFVLFVADSFGRRTLFLSGSTVMGCCLLAVALMLCFQSGTPNPDVAPSSYNQAIIALLFLNVAAYNWSWGTLPFVYVSEIFPTRTREIGVAIALAVHWIFSIVFSITAPYMLRAWGWKIFLFYAIMCFVIAVYSSFFIKETKAKALEDMDRIFNHQPARLSISKQNVELVERV